MEDNRIVTLVTKGINPYYQSQEEISELLRDDLLPQITEQVKAVYFYGAGCTSEKSDLVGEAVLSVIPSAFVEVNNDLLGAARALCFDSRGIVCILGTGSNSCYYDGKKIVSNISPLGFILGDEGSAAVLGKKLVADYLKNMMPESLRLLFHQDYAVTTADVLNRVYRTEFPNRYLSEFAPFLSKNIANSYCEKLVISEFQDFVQRNVLNYKESMEIPANFAGSVAYFFEPQLKLVLLSNGLKLGRIVRNPIDILTEYHGRK